MSPATRARKVARVQELAGKGDTNRVIAKKVGVSEATVRRWRRIPRAADDAPDDALDDAPGDAPACDTGATDDAAECVTGASPAASSDAPKCVTTASSPASEPDHLTVPLDADMRDHLAEASVAPAEAVTRDDAPDAVVVPLDNELRRALAVLAEAGYDPAAALRMCVEFVASSLARRWGQGVIPRGQVPLMRIEFRPLAVAPQTPLIRHRRDETLTP